ncbi:MAG: PAS domain-containing sensor histidine kinase [Bdellovibrionota bacterium]
MRFLLAIEAGLYAIWWFVVHQNNPFDYNPLWSRLFVVAVPIAILVMSFRFSGVARNIDKFFYASLYLLTLHNFYANHINYMNVEWPVATCITITAVYAGFQSGPALFYFSLFTIGLGTYTAYLHQFIYPFYVPGLVTITLVMNVILYYRNRALQEVVQAKARFEKLFDATFEGIVLHESGLIIAVNESFTRLVGETRARLIGSPIIDWVAADSFDLVSERMAKPLETPYMIRAKKKNGLEFPVEIAVKSHLFEGREVRLIAIRDMSERQQMESERKKKLEAQAAVELRDQFISIASHELRTPLTPLKLANDILLDMLEDQTSVFSDQQVKKILQKSGNQIGRITRLIDDMLDVSRISRGHFALRLEDFDMVETVDQILQIYSEEIARCSVRVRSPVSLPVRLDRMRTEQVITNLLKNALIYGNSRPIAISVRAYDDAAVFSIRDHGIGIETEKMSHIFERYERAVSSKNYGGLGLGLYIVQQVVNAHQGRVRVRSRLGSGSRFTVVLPRAASPASVSFAP